MLDLRNNITIQELFSSTTYKTRMYDKCIYCNSDVENDYYVLNDGYVCQAYRCNCECAKEELKVKENLYYRLFELQKNIDKEQMLKNMHDMEVEKLDKKYEDLLEHRENLDKLFLIDKCIN